MTTITTQTIPTDIPTNIPSESRRGLRRLVAAFVAGAALSGAAAFGVNAVVDNGPSKQSSATPNIVYVSSSAPAYACPRVGPC